MRPRDLALVDRGPEPRRLGHGVIGVLVGNAELADDDLGVDARRVDVAEHFLDAAKRTAAGRRPARDLDQDHVRRLGLAAIVRRNLDVHDHPPVERDDEAEA